MKSSSQGQKVEKWIEKIKLWLKEQYSWENTLSYGKSASGNQMQGDQIADSDIPIWLAAQRAIPRYEGFLSSIGPRGRLIRKFLSTIGLLPSTSEALINQDTGFKDIENHLR